MPVEPGKNLLHYRIVDKIGEGGMGAVWRAVDTTLDREVAIKVLPGAVAADPERVARFDREARLLASLNHPNIAAVHSVHEHEGIRFIAQEFVPGEDLAAALARGAIDREEALRIAVQIATGLEAAHERGVIHRDLKPANVRLEPTGRAKILDFGLAKALAPGDAQDSSGGVPSQSLSPTMTTAGTVAGMILGTAGYMSPEQARGKGIDRRTDLWAFGCVLYEMLAGRKAFRGETVSDTVAAVLKEEPDWEALPEDVPAPIRRLLRRCLTKDPARRQAGAADARILIEDVLEGRYKREATVVERAGPGLPWLVAGAMAVVAAAFAWMALGSPQPAPPGTDRRLSVAFPTGRFLVYTLAENTSGAIALSPAGNRLAYVGEGETDDAVRLYIRDLDSFDPVPLTGTEGGGYPAFSPDGEWIVYAGRGQLEKIPTVGGASVPLAEIQNPRGLSWEHPDRILFAPSIAGGIWSVDPRGGDPVQVTHPDPSQQVISHRFPHRLPDDEHFLLTAKTSTLTSFDDALIMVASLATGETRTVLQGGMDARYHDGHLVYGRDGGLFAVPFDPVKLETTGTPFPIVRGVMTAPAWGCAQYDIDASGTIVYVPGDGGGGNVELAWSDSAGSLTPIATVSGGFGSLHISPDGRHAIATIQRANDGLWMLDTERGSLVPFLSVDGNAIDGVWSRDGRRIAYASDRTGSYDIYLMPSDGGDPGELLVRDEFSKVPFGFSPDDSRLLYQRVASDTGVDIWLVPIEGDRHPEPFLVGAADEMAAAFSPDGRWIAYVSDDTGTRQVYARPYPGPGPPVRISEHGGRIPIWSADSRTLFYRENESLLAVPVRTGNRLEVGNARRILTVPGRSFIFDTHPDGRFLLALSDSTARRSHEVRLVRTALKQRPAR